MGVQRLRERNYRGLLYRVDEKPLGVTVRRSQFQVNIHDLSGNPMGFIGSLASRQAAQRAAEAWIDAALAKSPSLCRSLPAPHTEFWIPLSTEESDSVLKDA